MCLFEAFVGVFLGRSVPRGLLSASPGSRILTMPLPVSKFSACVGYAVSKGALGWTLPNPCWAVPGCYAGVTELDTSSPVRAAGRPMGRGCCPGGKGARWRQTVEMSCHRNPSLLSPAPPHRTPAPWLAPGDRAPVLGGAARGPLLPWAQGSTDDFYHLFTLSVWFFPQIQDVILQAACPPAASPKKISPYLPPHALAGARGG